MASTSKACQYIVLVTLLFLDIFLELAAAEGGGKKEKPPCQSNGHVCTSLMKYPDDSVFDEGPYCTCPGCSSVWKEDDWQSLSWPHYERADKIVQYRFCIPILPKRTCERGDLAVTMETETGTWTPHMREVRCSCPNNKYQLLGWWRQPLHRGNNITGLWVYEYFCEKNYCENEDSLCAKIYRDHEEGFTLGYHFLCACQKGFKCPGDNDNDDEDLPPLEKDTRGSYHSVYCKPVFKSAKRLK